MHIVSPIHPNTTSHFKYCCSLFNSHHDQPSPSYYRPHHSHRNTTHIPPHHHQKRYNTYYLHARSARHALGLKQFRPLAALRSVDVRHGELDSFLAVTLPKGWRPARACGCNSTRRTGKESVCRGGRGQRDALRDATLHRWRSNQRQGAQFHLGLAAEGLARQGFADAAHLAALFFVVGLGGLAGLAAALHRVQQQLLREGFPARTTQRRKHRIRPAWRLDALVRRRREVGGVDQRRKLRVVETPSGDFVLRPVPAAHASTLGRHIRLKNGALASNGLSFKGGSLFGHFCGFCFGRSFGGDFLHNGVVPISKRRVQQATRDRCDVILNQHAVDGLDPPQPGLGERAHLGSNAALLFHHQLEVFCGRGGQLRQPSGVTQSGVFCLHFVLRSTDFRGACLLLIVYSDWCQGGWTVNDKVNECWIIVLDCVAVHVGNGHFQLFRQVHAF
mmetsp:Transcript_27942/g.47826  ORF Transcript_27942/g.47826 Transcript_27942/m.47826 type:complete len:446 (-) Transcript_27942:455-1792(-)